MRVGIVAGVALTVAALAESSEELLLGAAFASRAVQHGHVCADLPRLVAAPLLDREEQPLESVRLPELERWLPALSASTAVSHGEHTRPLVLDGAGRLYLERYYRYERLLSRRIRERAARVDPIDKKVLRLGLALLFKNPSDPGEARQRLAALRDAPRQPYAAREREVHGDVRVRRHVDRLRELSTVRYRGDDVDASGLHAAQLVFAALVHGRRIVARETAVTFRSHRDAPQVRAR